MNDNDRIKARRLRAALTGRSTLSLEEARSHLPELVMAQLAGEDVEQRYADVLVALDQFPELAEEYALLIEAMEGDLTGEAPLPAPPPIPRFFAEEHRSASGTPLRRLGEQARSLLVQLVPKPRPQPIVGVARETPAVYMPTVEYINEWLAELPEPINLTAVLQPTATAWELIVSLIPDSAGIWRVTATLGEQELPVVSRDRFVTRFGPLEQVPQQPITLLCVPETT
jgi:hypothetical protein